MDEIFFSVVIPLYNKEDTIVAAINGVLAQAYDAYEVVIIDDGSSDGSAERVKQMRCDKISLFHKVNGGVSSARNEGIKKSKGEWIAFLDADDIWCPHHLSHLRELISRFPGASMVSSTCCKVGPGFILDKLDCCESGYRVSHNFFKDSQGPRFSVHSSAVAIQRQLFDQVGGFLPYNLGEDVEMWARIAVKEKIVMSTRQTSFYRKDPVSGLSSEAFLSKAVGTVKEGNAGLYSTPALRMLKTKIENKEISVDEDIKTYIEKRLKVGAKVRIAQGDISGLKFLLKHRDWKYFCSPCFYDVMRYLPAGVILVLKALYVKAKGSL
jgi:glycosyltransferase involved in cell wall biosynthesis